jgi:uncharacterized protein YpmB
MKDELDVPVWLVVITIIYIAFSMAIGIHYKEDAHNYNQLRKQAIEKGFAEYNNTTGKWQWKENKK